MFRKLVTSLLIFFLFTQQIAFAANIYVGDHDTHAGYNSGGSADGSDWNNTYDEVSSAESAANRNDTIYIGDGDYSAVTFNTSASGSTYIYIKKATSSDHGTSTGWSSSYGDGQGVFTGTVKFETAYWKFNGNTSTPPTGVGTYGFKITADTSIYGIYQYGSSYVTIKDTDVDNRGSTKCITGEVKCVQGHSGRHHITLINCRFINWGDAVSTQGDDVVIEYCEFHRSLAGTQWAMDHDGEGECGDCEHTVDGDGFCSDADHGDGVVYIGDDGTIRYNLFDWQGQTIFFSGSAANEPYDNLIAHGNTFFGAGAETGGAFYQNSTYADVTNIVIYNNTMVSYKYPVNTNNGQLFTGVMRNNIFWDCTTIESVHPTSDYNAYPSGFGLSDTNGQVLSSHPFVTFSNDDDASNDDFHLSAATDAGDSTIGSQYNTDPDGVTRGDDSNWDIGAYEYDSGVAPVVTGYDPAKSETGVNKDTNIEFIIYDATNDVDLDTIVMTEESNYHCCSDMVGTCPGSGAKDLTCTDYSVLGDGYTVVYNPGTDYSYEQIINVTIDADDDQGNSMDQDSYSFTIESAPSELTNNGSIMNGCSIE